MIPVAKLGLKARVLAIVSMLLFLVLGANTAINIHYAAGYYINALMARLSATAEGVTKDIDRAVGLGIPLDGLSGMGERLRELASRDPEIAYAMVMDMDGRVLYSSDASLEGEVKADEGAKRALSADRAVVHQYQYEGRRYYEKAFPIINPENKKIGVFRIALKEEAVGRQTRGLFTASLIIGIISFIVAMLMLYIFINKTVTNPVSAISHAAGLMASGDLRQTVKTTGSGEVAELGKAINAMSLSLKEAISRLRDMGTGLGEAIDLIVSVTRKMSKGARVQQEAIEQTAMTAEEMVASIRGVAENAAAVSASAADASSAVAEMAASIEEVAQGTVALSDAAEGTASSISQMLAAVRQISSSLEALSSSAEQTSSAVTEISASIKEVEQRAVESARLAEKVSIEATERGVVAAKEAIQGMENIKEAVQKTAEVINRLGRRSQEIGRILKVIDEVTDQTGLLALNAAILAAQAGEHGKGFSVIAEEIKDLAERTAASTQEIAGLISIVRREADESVQAMEKGMKAVEDGADLVRVTSDVLTQVAESSQRAAESARTIERTTSEQARGISQTTEAVIGITEQIEQIARAIEELKKGGERILQAAEQMRDATHRVKLATQEQTTGSRQIAKSMEAVTGQAWHVAGSTSEQQKAIAQISEAIGRIQKITQESVDLSIELDIAMQSLKEKTAALGTELAKFRF